MLGPSTHPLGFAVSISGPCPDSMPSTPYVPPLVRTTPPPSPLAVDRAEPTTRVDAVAAIESSMRVCQHRVERREVFRAPTERPGEAERDTDGDLRRLASKK